MSPKRGDRVARPAGPGDWTLRFGSRSAAETWEQQSNGRLAHALARFHDIAIKDPRWPGSPDRHHRLKGELATATIRGRPLERWQHELTGAGRVWFLIDDDKRTVWIDVVSPGHPPRTA